MHYVVKCTPQQAKALASAGQPFPSHALQKCGNAVEIDIRVVIFMFEGYHRGFFQSFPWVITDIIKYSKDTPTISNP